MTVILLQQVLKFLPIGVYGVNIAASICDECDHCQLSEILPHFETLVSLSLHFAVFLSVSFACDPSPPHSLQHLFGYALSVRSCDRLNTASLRYQRLTCVQGNISNLHVRLLFEMIAVNCVGLSTMHCVVEAFL